MGKFIRGITRFEYNHVSVALCEEMQPMFSFARYQAHNPLRGGFIEESWLRYLYYNKDVSIKVFELEVETENYEKVEDEIKTMMDHCSDYRYDFRGLVLKGIYRPKKRNCLSFANGILKIATQNPQSEFRNIKSLCLFLEQHLVGEQIIKIESKGSFTWGNDQFYGKRITE